MSIDESDILFIVNPKAGLKKIDSVLKSIIRKGLKYTVTHNLDELESIISKEIDNYKVFVAVGGDGTVNSLAKYLLNKEQKAMAVLPVGSGNGFAHELGFSGNLDRLIHSVKSGEVLKIDVLSIHNNDFLNVAGIGLDAEVAHRFHHFRHRGFFNYIVSSIISYTKFKPFQATIIHENGEITDTFQMISIANSRQFGCNAYISPNSKPFDGRYEIVAVKPIPLNLVLKYVYHLFAGNISTSRYVNYIACNNESTIVTDFKKFHSDGDPFFSDGVFEIGIKKNSLNVIKTTSEN
jgi:diacylglycerol kinase (ATP)